MFTDNAVCFLQRECVRVVELNLKLNELQRDSAEAQSLVSELKAKLFESFSPSLEKQLKAARARAGELDDELCKVLGRISSLEGMYLCECFLASAVFAVYVWNQLSPMKCSLVCRVKLQG